MPDCTKCLHTLDPSSFYLRPDGEIRQPCKSCVSKDNKEYRSKPENLERKKQLQRDRYKTDTKYREGILLKSKGYRRKHYLKVKFNLTEAQVEEMKLSQDNRCLICLETFDSNVMKHCIDHCHVSGSVRGLLCPLCNKAIGLFKENPESMQRAIDYLSTHKD